MQSVTCCCFSGEWAYAKAALTATITLLAIGLIGYYANSDSASFQQGFLGAFGSAAGLSFLVFLHQLIKNCGAEVAEAPLSEEQNLVKRRFDRLKQNLEVVDRQLRSSNTRWFELGRSGQDPKSPEYIQISTATLTLRRELDTLRDEIRTLIQRDDFNRIAFSEHPLEHRAQARRDFDALFSRAGEILLLGNS